MLSIIIPAKNEGAYLGQLLEDLKQQNCSEPQEIIVAVAPSVDNTEEVARRYGAQIVAGGLPSFGRNQGALKAQGDIWLFLDADVRLPVDFLEKALTEFQARALDIASTYMLSDTDELFDIFMYRLNNLAQEISRPFFGYLPGACIFIKPKCFQALGGFDEKLAFAEDADLGHRAWKQGAKIGTLKSTYFVASTRRLHKDSKRETLRRALLASWSALSGRPSSELIRYFGTEDWHIKK